MRFRKGDTKVFLARDRELWWLWTADTDRVVRVTNGSDHTTIVDVFQRIGITPLTCSRTAVEFQAVAGETYAIRIESARVAEYRETKAHFPHGIVGSASRRWNPRRSPDAYSTGFSQTETCERLSLVRGSPRQPDQRS